MLRSVIPISTTVNETYDTLGDNGIGCNSHDPCEKSMMWLRNFMNSCEQRF
jgi:hypothetical protein